MCSLAIFNKEVNGSVTEGVYRGEVVFPLEEGAGVVLRCMPALAYIHQHAHQQM